MEAEAVQAIPEVLPVGNRILFMPDVLDEHRTAGGIYVPKTTAAEKEATQGTVVAVGDKVEIKLQPKDRILVGRYTPIRIKLNGKVLFLVQDTDVLAVIADDADVELGD